MWIKSIGKGVQIGLGVDKDQNVIIFIFFVAHLLILFPLRHFMLLKN